MLKDKETGNYKHPLYNSWKVAKRSKMICEEWKDFKVFYEWAILYWTKGKKLSRLNRQENYGPENCIFTGRKKKVKTDKVILPELVEIVCEYCGEIFNRKRNKKHKGKICCSNKECVNKKKKETSLSNYGVEHHAKLEYYKNKSSEKLNSNDAKLKRENTNLERYSHVNVFGSDEIKSKIKSHWDSFGVSGPAQVQEIRQKQISSLIKSHGVTTPLKNNAILEKAKQTNKKKYGNESYAKTEHFKMFIKDKTKKYEGKTLKQLAEDSGKAYSTFVEQKNKYGLEYAINISKRVSGLELMFESFLKEHNIEYKTQVQIDNYRLDFLIGNLAIELDGLYWHSDTIIENKNYHKDKRSYYIQKNLVPVFIRENEILDKFDIVKSVILNKLKLSKIVYARKTQLQELQSEIGREFIKQNHLMKPTGGEYIGLYHNNELCCVMQFLVKEKEIHIQRFCNLIYNTVVGGYSKLLKYITNKYKQKVINFVDLRYGSGKHLYDLGFKLEKESISFMWTNYKDTFHRMKFPSNTGYEYGLSKIWDCGQAKFVKY